MNDMTFERRARAWLEDGPSSAPAETVAAILSALETAPQRPALVAPLRAIDGLTRRDPLDVGIAELRPRDRRRTVVLLAAAALLIVALVGLLVLAGRQPDEPPPPPTADLLEDFPLATVVLDESSGVPGIATSADATPTDVEVGRVRLDASRVLAATCSGSGEARIWMRTVPDEGSDPEPTVTVPCTDTPKAIEEAALAGEPETEYRIWMQLPAGASWRIVVGEYPASISEVRSFGTLEGTEGWTLINDLKPPFPILLTRGAGVAIHVPAGASRLAVMVECQLDATITVGLRRSFDQSLVAGNDDASRVACPTTEPRRVEFPVQGGADLDVAAMTDAPVWARLYVEADADATGEFPAAPSMPDDVAGTGYSSTVGGFAIFGTLGSNRELRLPYPDGTTGPASGDYVPVTTRDPASGESRFDLVSISNGAVAQTVVTERQPRTIFNGWVDATNGRAIWVTGTADAFILSDAALDGSSPREVATVPRDFRQLGLQQALDDSAFVLQWCDEAGCHRVVIDGPTGAVTAVELADADACSVVGVIDGLIVERVNADGCGPDVTSAPTITVAPLTGGKRRSLLEAQIGGQVIRSAAGPQLVYVGDQDTDHPTIEALDLATGDTRVLDDAPELGAYVQPIHLPAGWVLIANVLGLSPAFPAQNDGPPLLLNVDTGERIELVNLPHRADTSSP
jgi:hypothetical protein